MPTAFDLDLRVQARPTCRGIVLDDSPEAFGSLTPLLSRETSADAVREHFSQHGYLFIREFFDPAEVLRARESVVRMLAEGGMLDDRYPVIDAVAHSRLTDSTSTSKGSVNDETIGAQNRQVRQLIYSERTLAFFARILDGPATHFDYTWFRAVPPGFGTVPHCDHVYMGRGSRELYTCWTPFGEVPLEMGGLMVLEGSHLPACQKRLASYLRRDVDDYCINRPLPKHVNLAATTDNKVWNGWLARNARTLRNNLGGRWLTAHYYPGDAIIFPTTLVHAGLDNHTNRFRLSSDSRYQRASDPIDPRFVGPGPWGHVGKAKRGRVC